MKNFSMPRLVLSLWFLNYTFLSLVSYVWGNGRHLIMDYIVYASVYVVLELVFLGLIEDKL